MSRLRVCPVDLVPGMLAGCCYKVTGKGFHCGYFVRDRAVKIVETSWVLFFFFKFLGTYGT